MLFRSCRAAATAPVAEDAALSYGELLATLEARERTYVRSVMVTSRGNKAEAARRLGVTRYALYRTLRRLGIEEEADAMLEVAESAVVGAGVE